MKSERAFTIAETMVVAVILGMMLTAVVAAVAPLFDAPARAQAKSDSLAPAASGMYLLERDLRESNVNAVFACTGRPAMCGDGALDAEDSAIVVPTAYASSTLGAQFRTIGAAPDWQGFIVYWQRAPGGVIYRTFEPEKDLGVLIDARPADRTQLRLLADAAAASVTSDIAPPIAMRSIATLAAFVDLDSDTTSFHVVCAG